MDNVIESYLVKLGFEISQPELNKFKGALKEAGTAAETHTSGLIGQFVKWQTAIVGAFTSVGIASVAMVDKFAQADLQMQITAQKMYLPIRVARELKNSLDILGLSLEDAAWNPEARGRLPGLMGEMRALEEGLGPGFENTMMKIRSVTIEFRTWLQVLEYIGMRTSAALFNALGGEQFLEKIRGWTSWLIKHAPEISDWLTRVLVPILKDAEHVLRDVWMVAEKLAEAFVRIVGAISGDDSLRNGAMTFESLGKAIDKAADYMVRFVDAMTSAQLVVIDMVMALADLVRGFVDLANLRFDKAAGDFSRAGGDAKSAAGDLTGGGALILGAGALALGRGALRAGAGGLVEGAGGAAGVAGIVGSALAAVGLGGLAQYLSRNDDLSANTFAGRELAWENKTPFLRWLNGLRGNGGQTDNSALASSVAWAESGGHQIDPRTGRIVRSRAGALGMMQLMPDTAAKLGVNPYDANQNLAGGVRLLSMLMQKYGNIQEVLAAYNWGEGHLDAALRRHNGQFALDYLPRETQDYIRRIEGHMGAGTTVNVGGITINGTNLSGAEITKRTSDGIEDALKKHNRKELVNAQGVYT